MPEAASNAWNNVAAPADTAPRTASRDGVRWLRVAAVAAGFFLVFYIAEHDPENFAGAQIGDTSEDDIKDLYIDRLEDGNSLRKAALVAYGVVGFFAIGACRDRPWNVRGVSAALLVALLLWTTASVVWSEDPSLAVRRLAALWLIVVGSLGFARMLRPNEFLAVVLTSLTAFVLYSLSVDMAAGGRPWSGDYRFGGSLHPNIQAAYCGVLCLAAYCQPVGFGRRWMTRALFLFAFVLLLQTLSRTSAAAVLVGLLAAFLVRLSPRVRWWAASMMVALAAVAAIAIGSLSDGARKSLTEAVLLGRTEKAGSLTGRVPLWQELVSYASDRPVNGYGYETFWTADRIADVMKSQEWALQSAHNAYFEVVLQLGFVGLALVLGFLLSGFNLLQSAYARTQAAGYAFGYGVIGFALANGLLESHFVKLKYPTVIALIALMSVVAYFPTEEDAVDPEVAA